MRLSRTIFVGNLEKTTTYEDLRRVFIKYGKILDIDLKKIEGVIQYAFIQYSDMNNARSALNKLQVTYLRFIITNYDNEL